MQLPATSAGVKSRLEGDPRNAPVSWRAVRPVGKNDHLAPKIFFWQTFDTMGRIRAARPDFHQFQHFNHFHDESDESGETDENA